MAKLRIELLSGERVVDTQEIPVTAVSGASAAVPAMGGRAAIARLTALGAAVSIATGSAPVATAGGGVRLARGKPFRVSLGEGDKVAAILATDDDGGDQSTFTATIPNTFQLSGAIDLGQKRAVGLILPAVFTGTSVTFHASADGVTFYDLYQDGALLTVAVGTSRRVALDPLAFFGVQHLKIKSASVEGADRIVTVVAQ